MSETDEKISLKHIDNKEFYEKVPVDVFKEFPVIGGLDTGCDIDFIYPYIKDCNSVVEVGAAYGRVIDLLLKKGYLGSITAIERSRNFYTYLLNQYDNRATLICDDLMQLEFTTQFDCVLFLWSGISEWNLSEQILVLQKLYAWVANRGFFIFDILDSEQVPLKSVKRQGQFYKYENEYGIATGFTPTRDQVLEYISLIDPGSYKIIPYTTKTNRKRLLFLLERR